MGATFGLHNLFTFGAMTQIGSPGACAPHYGDFPRPNLVAVINVVDLICMGSRLVQTYMCSTRRRLGETCINIMEDEVVKLSNILATQLVFIEKGLIHASHLFF